MLLYNKSSYMPSKSADITTKPLMAFCNSFTVFLAKRNKRLNFFISWLNTVANESIKPSESILKVVFPAFLISNSSGISSSNDAAISCTFSSGVFPPAPPPELARGCIIKITFTISVVCCICEATFAFSCIPNISGSSFKGKLDTYSKHSSYDASPLGAL